MSGSALRAQRHHEGEPQAAVLVTPVVDRRCLARRRPGQSPQPARRPAETGIAGDRPGSVAAGRGVAAAGAVVGPDAACLSGDRSARGARTADDQSALRRHRSHGPPLCGYRRGRPSGARPAGSDVAGGAARRHENACRRRYRRHRGDRDLPVASAAARSVRRRHAGASERHPLCHRHRPGRCCQQRGGGQRPGRGARAPRATSRPKGSGFSTRATRIIFTGKSDMLLKRARPGTDEERAGGLAAHRSRRPRRGSRPTAKPALAAARPAPPANGGTRRRGRQRPMPLRASASGASTAARLSRRLVRKR